MLSYRWRSLRRTAEEQCKHLEASKLWKQPGSFLCCSKGDTAAVRGWWGVGKIWCNILRYRTEMRIKHGLLKVATWAMRQKKHSCGSNRGCFSLQWTSPKHNRIVRATCGEDMGKGNCECSLYYDWKLCFSFLCVTMRRDSCLPGCLILVQCSFATQLKLWEVGLCWYDS